MALHIATNVLNAHDVLRLGKHPLADGPNCMDDNARPHRVRIVREFSQQKAIDTFQG